MTASASSDALDHGDRKTPDSGPRAANTRSRKRTEVSLDGGAHIGRYVVLYRHGRGGMGQVYAAYDPELDRRVAIKLLRKVKKRGRDPHGRLVREAQALARLSHPHVVAIHDVGVHEGRVWVAMDFLEGLTLRRWLAAQARSLAEILDVFGQAGQGLAAAHKAGLVHRDFKPDNVIVDAEGRAQVLDFGLARASTSGGSGVRRGSFDSADPEPAASSASGSLSLKLTREGALVGTPAYMAPEQHQRRPTDERSDQFAYCLALYEAVYREPAFAGDDEKQLAANVIAGSVRDAPRTSKVPAWLRRVLLRGLATSPSERWPSMQALLTELSRDRRRPLRRLLPLGAGVIGLSAAGLSATALLSSNADRCADADAPIRDVWNAERRTAIAEAFGRSTKPYAAAAWRNAAAVFDAHADAWARARRDACEATWVTGVQPQQTLVLRLSCLQRRLDEFDGLAQAFAAADDTVVEHAVVAAHDLGSIEGCADVMALASDVPLPDDPRDRVVADELRARLSEARTLERAGKYRVGVETASGVVEDAAALAFRPVQAEALVVLGRLQVLDGHTRKARETLQDAVFAAEAGGHTVAAAQAWVLLLEVAYLHPELHADAAIWERHAAALVERMGPRSQLDAELQRTTGNLRSAQARHDEAVRHLRRGVEILQQRDTETPKLGEMLTDLGNAYTSLGRFDEARVHHERALGIVRAQLGPEHPAVAAAMTGLAVAYDELGRPEDSYPLYERAVAIFTGALGPWHPSVATALNNYAGVLYAKGDYRGALKRFERAAAIWEAAYGPDNPDVALTLGNIGLALEGLERWPEAIDYHQRALTLREKVWGPNHPDVEISLRNLGDLYWYRGDFERARTHHERAIAILEASLGAGHPRLAAPLEGLAADLASLQQTQPALKHYRRALTLREAAVGSAHPRVAAVLAEIGTLHLTSGNPQRALASLQRAMAIYDGEKSASAARAQCRFALARAVLQTSDDVERATMLATAARAELVKTQAGAEALAPIDAWLAER